MLFWNLTETRPKIWVEHLQKIDVPWSPTWNLSKVLRAFRLMRIARVVGIYPELKEMRLNCLAAAAAESVRQSFISSSVRCGQPDQLAAVATVRWCVVLYQHPHWSACAALPPRY